MFRSAFEQGAQLGAGPVARLWRGFLLFFSRWWQLETLYRSNMKYQPDWVPRFACYEDARLVPRVGVASVHRRGFPGAAVRRGATNSTPAITRQCRRTVGVRAAAARRLRTGCRRRCSRLDFGDATSETAAPARTGACSAGQVEDAAGQGHRRLSGGSAAQSHRRPGARRRRPDDCLGVRPGAADPGLRRCAVRAIARLVSRSPTAA